MIWRDLRTLGIRSLFVAALMVVAGCGSDEAPPLLVDTTEGPVQGTLVGDVRYFLGIPYAAPPVGDLRFLPPAAPAERDETLVADRFGPGCPGTPSFFDLVVRPGPTAEDCLSLNIWSPNKSGPRPVMFWIYGGGFVNGATNGIIYQAENLALAGDVVVVSINYRVNAFGLMSTDALQAEREGIDGGAGNMGFLDMLLALRWVQANISRFGGDPNNVTIFGESAGGTAVCALLAATGNEGLFHRAIIQSGFCEAAPLRSESGGTLDRGDELVAQLGCSGPDELSCLRALTPDQIIEGVVATGEDYGPTVDGVTFTDTPDALLQAGETADVPLIVGSNLSEVAILSLGRPTTLAALRDIFLESTDGDAAKADMLMSLYEVDIDADAPDAFVAFGTDSSFGCSALSIAEAAATAGREVYLYEFQHVVEGGGSSFGAAHGFEIPFVFGTVDRFSFFSADAGEREARTTAQMQAAWSSFARSGVPQLEGEWPRFTVESHEYLVIDDPSSVDNAFRNDRCAALRQLGL